MAKKVTAVDIVKANQEEKRKSNAKKITSDNSKKVKTVKPAKVAPAVEKKASGKPNSLDEKLQEAITEYNDIFTMQSDHGTQLFIARERSVDTILFIESLINSIANRPKEFDTTITEVQAIRKEFKSSCEFAEKELKNARNSAVGAGSGIAAGMAVVSMAPTAAMWVATTFGTASTGTAISTLSGAAANSAALAWLGGGALAAEGGGMAAGSALLALAGPIGWGIAGASILATIVIYSSKKKKLDSEKAQTIEEIIRNTTIVKKNDAKLKSLLKKTTELREKLFEQYADCMGAFGKSFLEIPEENQLQLATLVNNTKSLALLLREGI